MKTLLLDIETAPNLGWVWGKWEQDVIDFEKSWYILCFSYRWLGKKEITTVSLPQFKLYKKDRENDKALVEELHKVLCEADVVVAHNGDRFDIPKINTRFLFHGFQPPEPYKTVDTCKVARSKFGFDSNKLDEIGRYLGIGRKMVHSGFALWKGCMMGKTDSWIEMEEYNARDVELLEQVYLRLRPWQTNHPNVNVLDEEDGRCPVCSGDKLNKRGFSITPTGKKQRYQCQNAKCGAWSHGPSRKVIEIR